MCALASRCCISRQVSCCLLFICVSLTLPAGHWSSSYSALVYNDSLTLGLAENQDDLRSFGMEFDFVHESGWFGRSSVSGVTWRSRGEDVVGSRYDELVIEGGHRFHFHPGHRLSHLTINISPLFGLVFSGNMGYEAIQNFVHGSLSIEELSLPYETSGVVLHPRLGIEQSFEYVEPAPWFSVSDLVFRAEVDALFMPGYAGRLYSGIAVGHRTLSSSAFMVGLGYGWKQVFDGWASHEMVGIAETGMTAKVTGHFGMLAFSYRWYLETLQGFGGMGFDIGLGGAAVWRRNDLLLSLGFTVPWNMLSTSLRYRITKDLGIVVDNTFKMIPLADEGRVRENVSAWHVGVDYEFSRFDLGFMRPFSTISAGIRRFLVMKDAPPGVVDSNGRIRESDAVRFSMDGAVGVRFFPHGQVQYDGVAYGLEISGGIMFADTRGLVSAYVMELVDMWTPYMKVGITVGSHL